MQVICDNCDDIYFNCDILKAMCHTDALVWTARKIASMALPAARERPAKNC